MTFHGQWGPNHHVDQVLWENFFKDQIGGIIVECGSADGITESNTKFFEEQGWLCINIEPEPSRYKQLCENRLLKDNNINLDCVLSDCNDEIVTFDVGPQRGNFCTGKTYTFKSMVGKLSPVINGIDCFVLDVEGHELKVIDGMVGSKILPEVMCIEYTWDEVGLERLDEKLIPLGYTRLFLSYNNAFYSLTKKASYFGATDHWKNLGF